MIRQHLGEQIDLHGGGMDLVFPHHENEIAQSEGCTGKGLVKYWVHNNMINFGGAKMSKSVGNIQTARSFMDEHGPEIYKFMMLSVHYRSVLDLSDESIENSTSGLARIYSALAFADSLVTSDTVEDVGFSKVTAEAWTGIEASINDDFNTSEAFARVFEVVRQFNAQVKRGMKTNPAVSGKGLALIRFIKKFGAMMSLFQETPGQFLHQLDDKLLRKMQVERSAVDALVKERAQARLNKDFAKSDELRGKLTALGILVSDLPEGSFWEVAK